MVQDGRSPGRTHDSEAPNTCQIRELRINRGESCPTWVKMLQWGRSHNIGLVDSSGASRLAVAALVLVTGAVYLNSFPAAFHFDDYALILESPLVTERFEYGTFLEQYGGRPLTLWTFHLNYLMAGPQPWAFHLVSVLLHLAVVLLVFRLVLERFRNPGMALATALLFGLHPLQTQAVNYVWARSVLLMSGFGLAALLLAARRPWAAVLCFQLALWSRAEAAMLLPFLWVLNRERWRWWAGLTLANGLALAWSLVKYSPAGLAWNHPDPVGYWLLQPVMFWKGLGLFLWPSNLNLDHQVPASYLLLTIISVAALLGTAMGLLGSRWRCSALGTGLLWVLAFSLPTWILPNLDPFSETRLYLPSAGFALMAAWLLFHRRPEGGWPSRGQWVGIGILAALLIPPTLARNRVWNDDLLLWRDTVSKSPGKARPHYNLGVALLRDSQAGKAGESFRAAVSLDPEDDYNWAALGYLAELEGNRAGARGHYSRAVGLNPDNRYAQEGLKRVGENRPDRPAESPPEFESIPGQTPK